MIVSFEDFKKFLDFFAGVFNQCYGFLISISIAGLTLFDWIIGLMAVGAIFTVIRAFAGVGGVSVSNIASGAAEQIRSAQRQSYGHYESTRARQEQYKERYDNEHQ